MKDLGLLLLRLLGLYLALGHGLGKTIALATGQGGRFIEGVAALGFPLPVVFAWAAALSELGGGLLMAAGLFTRWAAAFAACTMVVAGFLRHRALSHLMSWLGIAPVSEEATKAWGNPELALVYCAACTAVALLGPGRFSVDAKLGRK